MIVSYGHSHVVHQKVTSAFQCVGETVECIQGLSRLSELIDGSRSVTLVIAGDSGGKSVDSQFIRDITGVCGDVPVVMWSRETRCAVVVEAIRAGVTHFLSEDFTVTQLMEAVADVPGLQPAGEPHVEVSSGRPGWERRLIPLLEKLRRVDTPLLIQGETGVGKENLARRIHDNSLRSRKTFLKMNCAALPSELVESELFGYEKGAFTGAFRNNSGKFEVANGGTLLLDEIGDMDLKVQAKLLQVLQDQEFIPLGARQPVKVDVRVMAATHRNLERAVEGGEFREDLYYRLNVINIVIPPLRERLDEVPGLARHFLEKHSAGEPIPPVTPQMLDAMRGYSWPGNLRELENTMRRYFVLRDPDAIVEGLRARSAAKARASSTASGSPPPQPPLPPSGPVHASAGSGFAAAAGGHLPPHVGEHLPPHVGEPDGSSLSAIDRMHRRAEADVIVKMLNATLWNRKEAAARLDMDYKALLYKMRKLNIGTQGRRRSQVAADPGSGQQAVAPNPGQSLRDDEPAQPEKARATCGGA